MMEDVISIPEVKVKNLVGWVTLKTLTELEVFLAVVIYSEDFIMHMTEISAQLYRLAKYTPTEG